MPQLIGMNFFVTIAQPYVECINLQMVSGINGMVLKFKWNAVDQAANLFIFLLNSQGI